MIIARRDWGELVSIDRVTPGSGDVALTKSLFDETLSASSCSGGRFRVHHCSPLIKLAGNLNDVLESCGD